MLENHEIFLQGSYTQKRLVSNLWTKQILKFEIRHIVIHLYVRKRDVGQDVCKSRLFKLLLWKFTGKLQLSSGIDSRIKKMILCTWKSCQRALKSRVIPRRKISHSNRKVLTDSKWKLFAEDIMKNLARQIRICWNTC